MPLELMPCSADGQKGWKAGPEGRCYIGKGARSRALKQLVAIKASKGELGEHDDYADTGAFLEVFRTGRQRDKTWSQADLDLLARNFSDLKKAGLTFPVVLGHTATDADPAQGWIRGLISQDGSLFADVEFTSPEAKAKAETEYANRSIEVWPDGPQGYAGRGFTLRRLALLGAEQPQVKGLAPIVNGENSSQNWEFWCEVAIVSQQPGESPRPDDGATDMADPKPADAAPAKPAEVKPDPLIAFGETLKAIADRLTAVETALKPKDPAPAPVAPDKAEREVAVMAFAEAMVAGGRLTPAEKDKWCEAAKLATAPCFSALCESIKARPSTFAEQGRTATSEPAKPKTAGELAGEEWDNSPDIQGLIGRDLFIKMSEAKAEDEKAKV